ncbi:CyP450 monooxygenase [Epithele typhae]|uniref:CyP450 monooxygenase n=1 Tax=Epithele typhae TaxID=378194 RepID=UPI0020083CD6|nr:CyP450 monooxygenase [Epithele typhae]KAH9944416.1 CyP450 monooxygenase [Epithele typhae]
MMDLQPAAALGSFLTIALTIAIYRRPQTLPLPPGPKPRPLVGNALDLPHTKQFLAFDQWAKDYGDIVHISLLGQPVIVLNSAEAVTDLLERRSAIYSDRYHSTVVDMIGWDWNVALMCYGTRWRQIRRSLHEHFHQSASRKFQPAQVSGARDLLFRMLQNPQNFVHDLRYVLGATILEVSYGVKAKGATDEYILIGERAVEGPTKSLVLGALWCEFLPFLRRLPFGWPGASFARKAVRYRGEAMDLKHTPFKKAMADMQSGTGTWSLATDVMTRDDNNDLPAKDREELAMSVAGVVYGAGADTSFSTLETFFLAMSLYPEVQCKAQAELDVVVGSHRLPEFADQSRLPYIVAIVKECLRWQNVFTLGLPHRVMEEDEYKGYRIPKGSMVLGNVWTMTHNPEMYPEPMTFMPERYLKDGALNPEVQDPGAFAFGFGRRACPGRHFALASIFIYAASVLHTFEIHPKKDKVGNHVEVDPTDLLHGVVSYPSKVECDIVPRSAEAAALVRNCAMQ